MSTIGNLIFDIAFKYSNSRKPKNWSRREPPPPQPYDEHEVAILVESIVHHVDSFLSDKFIDGHSKEDS